MRRIIRGQVALYYLGSLRIITRYPASLTIRYPQY